MISIPSVGSVVSGVFLNKDATKAKIVFDDGCSVIISTNNTGVMVSKKETAPIKTKTKKSIKKTVVESSRLPVKSYLEPPSDNAIKMALSKSKSRAERLAESTIDASQKMALNMKDGEQIQLT